MFGIILFMILLFFAGFGLRVSQNGFIESISEVAFAIIGGAIAIIIISFLRKI